MAVRGASPDSSYGVSIMLGAVVPLIKGIEEQCVVVRRQDEGPPDRGQREGRRWYLVDVARRTSKGLLDRLCHGLSLCPEAPHYPFGSKNQLLIGWALCKSQIIKPSLLSQGLDQCRPQGKAWGTEPGSNERHDQAAVVSGPQLI